MHTYLKKKNISNSTFWFFAGTFGTGMPIWGFFMLKYSFYSVSLRKFEEEQHKLMIENQLIKDYLSKKVILFLKINASSLIEDDEVLGN